MNLPPRPPEGDGAVDDVREEVQEVGMTCPKRGNALIRFN